MSNPSVSIIAPSTTTDNVVLMLTGVVVQGTYPIKYQVWTKDSGPDCTFTAAVSCINQVYELYPGTYVFRLTAYDQLLNTGTTTCTVTVSSNGGPLYLPGHNVDNTIPTDPFLQVGYTTPLDVILT